MNKVTERKIISKIYHQTKDTIRCGQHPHDGKDYSFEFLNEERIRMKVVCNKCGKLIEQKVFRFEL